MKTIAALILLMPLVTKARGETPAQILEDYRTKATAACQKLNTTLQNEGTTIAAALVAKGDTASATTISQQIEAKIRGETVSPPHNAISTLFVQYDAARNNTLKPIKAASIQRLETALKASAGKDMKTVLELAKAREEIEGGKVQIAASSASTVTSASIPMAWTYHLSPDRQKLNGELTLKDNGKLVLGNADSQTPGRWERTSQPNVLKIFLDKDGIEETCEMRISGSEAVLERSIGIRYLKKK